MGSNICTERYLSHMHINTLLNLKWIHRINLSEHYGVGCACAVCWLVFAFWASMLIVVGLASGAVSAVYFKNFVFYDGDVGFRQQTSTIDRQSACRHSITKTHFGPIILTIMTMQSTQIAKQTNNNNKKAFLMNQQTESNKTNEKETTLFWQYSPRETKDFIIKHRRKHTKCWVLWSSTLRISSNGVEIPEPKNEIDNILSSLFHCCCLLFGVSAISSSNS